MKLTNSLQQSKILYFSQIEQSISVHENKHYRWLAFDNVIQSMMLKRKPWLLTFPHQIAMMMPLLFTQPKSVVEFGLGGGNLSRFIKNCHTDINISSVESSATVIECFQRYFSPYNSNTTIFEDNALDWLFKQKTNRIDWFISDIYQAKQSIEHSLNLTKNILKKIPKQSIFTLNLPSPNNDEIAYFLACLREIAPTRHIIYFHVPNYLNIIVHSVPKQVCMKMPTQHKQSYLPLYQFKRWQKFWRHGIQLRR